MAGVDGALRESLRIESNDASSFRYLRASSSSNESISSTSTSTSTASTTTTTITPRKIVDDDKKEFAEVLQSLSMCGFSGIPICNVRFFFFFLKIVFFFFQFRC